MRECDRDGRVAVLNILNQSQSVIGMGEWPVLNIPNQSQSVIGMGEWPVLNILNQSQSVIGMGEWPVVNILNQSQSVIGMGEWPVLTFSTSLKVLLLVRVQSVGLDLEFMLSTSWSCSQYSLCRIFITRLSRI